MVKPPTVSELAQRAEALEEHVRNRMATNQEQISCSWFDRRHPLLTYFLVCIGAITTVAVLFALLIPLVLYSWQWWGGL